ncbi:hypothetical protein JN531_003680 [Flagellatimonas centrodinii]|uniref:hypothetical protein n=1 Tax=Flagellatimonas centrodinii TaxID=2806210 RepID=UPI001FEF7180|nr:hypothetical protein [Flagellatimonas centrodinii]ULQ47387.1 hypothetical protein JN531_003680 [Flagellatimonas centrodinii]
MVNAGAGSSLRVGGLLEQAMQLRANRLAHAIRRRPDTSRCREFLFEAAELLADAPLSQFARCEDFVIELGVIAQFLDGLFPVLDRALVPLGLGPCGVCAFTQFRGTLGEAP